MEDSEFIEKVRRNLERSSSHYDTLVKRKKRDIEIYSGAFWTDSLIEECNRKGRLNRAFNTYSKFANAIVSPFSKSPYHADIDDVDGVYKKVQEDVDYMENTSNAKYVFSQALRSAAVTGVGFFVLSVIDGKIEPEIVKDISCVALDPNIIELDGSDAEWGAIVNYISVEKAKRLYGEDVVNYDETSLLSSFGSQWDVPNGSVAVISYYEMSECKIILTRICGNKVVNHETLNVSRIPIYRICFNEIVRNGKFDYNGIVDMTADLQFGMNLGYSTLLERANRSPKANFMMPAKALDGLDEFYQKLRTKESLVCLYNGDVAPTPIVEQYQTQDLMNTISQCTDLMVQTIGIPAGGINPAQNSMTATEILVQQNNSESNVEALYTNASNAIYSFCFNMIELLCWRDNIDKLPTFKLINGPQIITKLMKRRQELIAVSALVDEKTKMLIAKQYIETLDEELKEPLIADMIANAPELQFVSDSNVEEDPRAIATLTNMNSVLQQTQDELEKQIAANAELQKELDSVNLQLLNQKQQQLIDWQKHVDDMRLREQQMQIDAAKANADIQDADAKAAIEQTKLQKELVDLEKKKMEVLS